MSHALGPVISTFQPGHTPRLISAAVAAVLALLGGYIAFSELVLQPTPELGGVAVGVIMLFSGIAFVLWTMGRSVARLEKFVCRVGPSGPLGPPTVAAKTSESRASGFPRLARMGKDLFLAWTETGEPSHVRTAVLTIGSDR